MNKSSFKNVLIGLLIVITAFSAFKYGTSLKEKYDTFIVMNQLKEQLDILEQEKQNLLADLEKGKQLEAQLTEENTALKDNIKATRIRLTKLFMEQREKEKAYEELSYRFSLLQAENANLIEEKGQLDLRVSQAESENQALKVKLSSIQELKKAIRELKRRMRPERLIAARPRKNDEVIDGNRGYLIKDGKSTYRGRIRVEVRPAPPIPAE
ncbi:MAG: hypothetical protein AMJ95_02230 [Omnitrophica WOR_2 bacterium SM23_72]|nr:MAG: hypothetical protein AMJ95_02230 [Omnitrophica WOR_2 bacterium SM23_72]